MATKQTKRTKKTTSKAANATVLNRPGQSLGKKKAGPKPPKSERPSLLNAAVAALKGAPAEGLAVRAIIERIAAGRLWAPTRGGKTPHATLAAAMAREIANKGADSRFQKTGRGLFALRARKS